MCVCFSLVLCVSAVGTSSPYLLSYSSVMLHFTNAASQQEYTHTQAADSRLQNKDDDGDDEDDDVFKVSDSP